MVDIKEDMRQAYRACNYWTNYSTINTNGVVFSCIKYFNWLSFLAGIMPGIIMGFVLMFMNAYLSSRRNFATEDPVPLREVPGITVRAFPALLMPAILLFGIYGGITTPTEAAAIATLYALFLALLLYRALSFKSLYEILVDSARSSV